MTALSLARRLGPPADLLTAEEECELARRGDVAELVERNLPLTQWFAARYCLRSGTLEDVAQEAVLGLDRAARTFDPDRGFRFATYAHKCMRQALQLSRFRTGSLIRVSVNVHLTMAALARGRAPKVPHPSPPALLAAAARALAVRTACEFAAPGGDDDDRYDPTALASPDPADPDARIDDAEALARLVAAFRFLPAREAEAIRLRYGLADGRGRTMEEAGARMGITKQRVQQLEARAMARLRKALGAGEVAA